MTKEIILNQIEEVENKIVELTTRKRLLKSALKSIEKAEMLVGEQNDWYQTFNSWWGSGDFKN